VTQDRPGINLFKNKSYFLQKQCCKLRKAHISYPPVDRIMGNTRIVITVDKSVREEIRKRAKAEGRVLSAKYRELLLKGHQLETGG